MKVFVEAIDCQADGGQLFMEDKTHKKLVLYTVDNNERIILKESKPFIPDGKSNYYLRFAGWTWLFNSVERRIYIQDREIDL